MAFGNGVGDERSTGIGKKRRAGVGNERDRAALRKRVEQPPMREPVTVLVIGRDLRLDGVAVEKPPRHARILAGDEVGPGKRVERAKRHVAEISDRRCDHVERRLKRRGAERLAADLISAVLRLGIVDCPHFPQSRR